MRDPEEQRARRRSRRLGTAAAMARGDWRLVGAATLLLALVMGSRSALGLFVSPLNSATGIGLAGIAFAMAAGQLAQGIAQPAVGWLADRYGARRLIQRGVLALAVATLAMTAADSVLALTAVMAVMAVAATAVGSSSLLLAEVARRVPVERRALAFGVVSAGGSAGQMLFGPGTQSTIEAFGWIAAAVATAVVGLAAWPLALGFGKGEGTASRPDAGSAGDGRSAAGLPAFWLVGGSYAVCGFHIGYMTTHMPGVIERCGLPSSLAGSWLAIMGLANIAGSFAVAWWLRRHAAHVVLMAIYLLRGASVALLLALPPTPTLLLVFAVLTGLSYMALLPAISQQVADHFGVARMATLFGGIALVHQLGSFAGTWLGGVVAVATGRDTALWTIDIVLTVAAVAMQWRLGRPFARRPALAMRPA